jgi:hypothetical protein
MSGAIIYIVYLAIAFAVAMGLFFGLRIAKLI